ncbi:unnamed protein product [Cylicocyclus nassatus]|uniref:Uncharacterized protein n=1 Tax=Cylicocyclus nassatus TaxID=53992 RepID=A0AA36GGQ9_CYLNA|nr:unnamed protein product [Cylicocyclus nassatus]
MLVVQEKTLGKTDQNRLCLHLRNKIKAKYAEAGAKEPEIHTMRLRSKSMARNSGFHDWHGAPFEELLEFKLQKEYKEGTMHIGEIQLCGLENKKYQAPGPSYKLQ